MRTERRRRNVKVHVLWDEFGNIEPVKVFWDETYFYVDRIISAERKASAQAGGFGLCFKAQFTSADSSYTGISRVFFEQMPGQQCGVILDEENCSTPVQLWYFYDEHGERQNIKVLSEWSVDGQVRPLTIWIDHYAFEMKSGPGEWCAARKDGGDGIRFIGTITNQEQCVRDKPFLLFFDKCPQPEAWFIEEKIEVPSGPARASAQNNVISQQNKAAAPFIA